MYTISTSTKFQKQLNKLVRQNSKLKPKVAKTLHLLRKKPDHPSSRLHKLSGKKYWSISVTMDIRIIFGITGDKIYLLRIGKHKEVY